MGQNSIKNAKNKVQKVIKRELDNPVTTVKLAAKFEFICSMIDDSTFKNDK